MKKILFIPILLISILAYSQGGKKTFYGKYWFGDSVYFWGGVSGINSTMVGLSNVNNTSDVNKPISSATQTALNLKQATITTGTTLQYFRGDLSLATFPTTTAAFTNSTNKNFVTDAQLVVIGNTSGTNSGDNTANSTYASDYRAANFIAGTNYLAPNGNGSSLTGLTKTQVGLANVDNTSDVNKPISSATQTALNTKQATLVSGINIKTVNGGSLLGSGDIEITSAVGWGNITGTLSNQVDLQTILNSKLTNTTTSGVAASPTASGTVTVTHNLGRTPTTIRIKSISSFTSNAAATPVPFSEGTWNSTGNRCLYMVINGTTTQVSQTSTVFSIIMVTSAGNSISGVIGNVTPTSFDIVFTETGTHTAGNYLWEAQ